MRALKLLFGFRVPLKTRVLAGASIAGVAYFTFMTITTTILSWYEILPFLFKSDSARLKRHKMAVAFIFINAIGNFILCLKIDTSIGRILSKHKGKKQYSSEKMCEICKANQPIRSHHCYLCGTCILRRDHHCFFLTKCVGYYNHKHFIMYCFYMMCGTLYGMLLIVMYLHKLYDVVFQGPQTFIILLFRTILQLMKTTYPDERYIFLIFMMYGCLSAGLFTAGLWFWHMMITTSGQTTHEAGCGITSFSKSKYFVNFKDVFGKYWILLLFLPLPLPQNSDGAYKKESNKKD